MRKCFKDMYKEGYTHSGMFHADDVFSTAFLKILNPDIKITRGFSVPKDFNGIVYDIGLGRFDHHQKDSKIRANGIPYAAFGLLWEEFGCEIMCSEDVKRFDEEFVQPIDLADNTGIKNALALVIGDYNPTWKESDEQTETEFYKAVDTAYKILTYRFKNILAEREAYEIVKEKADKCKERIFYLDKTMPWKDAVKGLDIIYVIFESNRGGYCIQAVAEDNVEPEKLKKPFPKEWRGLPADKLHDLTGILNFNFCHMSGFLCVAETLEDAWKTAELALASF